MAKADKLELKLQCGATIIVKKSNQATNGFYVRIDQDPGTPHPLPWVTTNEEDPLQLDSAFVSWFMSDNPDLAKAFRSVADFIDGKVGY